MPLSPAEQKKVDDMRKANNDKWLAERSGKPAPAAKAPTKSSDETRSVLGKIRDAIDEALPKMPKIGTAERRYGPNGKTLDEVVDGQSGVEAIEHGIEDGNAENRR